MHTVFMVDILVRCVQRTAKHFSHNLNVFLHIPYLHSVRVIRFPDGNIAFAPGDTSSLPATTVLFIFVTPFLCCLSLLCTDLPPFYFSSKQRSKFLMGEPPPFRSRSLTRFQRPELAHDPAVLFTHATIDTPGAIVYCGKQTALVPYRAHHTISLTITELNGCLRVIKEVIVLPCDLYDRALSVFPCVRRFYPKMQNHQVPCPLRASSAYSLSISLSCSASRSSLAR